MKKIFLTLMSTLLLMSSALASDSFSNQNRGSSYFYYDCEQMHTTTEYELCIHLNDGGFLLSTTDETKYIKIDSDGTETEIYSKYRILGQEQSNVFTILTSKTVYTQHLGEVTKAQYGLLDSNFNLILEPIIDLYTNGLTIPHFGFDNYGMTSATFDITEYYYTGMGGGHEYRPVDGRKILIKNDGTLFTEYDAVYSNFVTENRYILKNNGISTLVDSGLNIITDEYAHIIELDYGKWYASKDPSQTKPIYDTVLDNNGNIITDFNPKLENYTNDWAKPYIEKATEYELVQTGRTTAFNTNFYTEEITRIEFCELVAILLFKLDYELPQITDYSVFNDTRDKLVLMCNELGIIDGVGNGNFDPYANLTREQAAKILLNVCELLRIDTSTSSNSNDFSDFNNISDWAQESVLKISALKTPTGESVMGGTADKTFSPKDFYNVDQAITTMVRIFESAQ